MWRKFLFLKVQQYIKRDLNPVMHDVFLAWWNKFGQEILNEFESQMDDEKERHTATELANLRALILINHSNIDHTDPNVQRILGLIDIFSKELKKPVDYTNPPDFEYTKEKTDPRIIDALKKDAATR